jgi:hypothetical protein
MDRSDQDPASPYGPFDANTIMELIESYQQTMRAAGKAWLRAWTLATQPDPRQWFQRSMQIWQDWVRDTLEASGGWWPGPRWFDRDQLSTLSFIIGHATEMAGPKEIALPIVTDGIDGQVQVDSSDLVRLDAREPKLPKQSTHEPAQPPRTRIPKDHVAAKIERAGRTLSVSLVDLKQLQLEAPMQFLGCIYTSAVPHVPLVLLHVHVAPDRWG